MSKFNFDKKAAKVRASIPVMLDKMANNAVYHFKVKNFDAGGFVDYGVKKWTPNKVSDGRKQLVDTDRMRESIRVLSKYTYIRVIGSDVPYAPYQNSGTKYLPKREFIGKSKELEDKNKKVINDTLRKIL